MKRLKMPMLSLLLSLLCAVPPAVATSYSLSPVTFNPLTGGYDDVAVIVDQKLDKKECPQILQQIKVQTTTRRPEVSRFAFG